ncbi:hypothetical protein E6C27_scaffold43059G00410 [Cucumis melo var. makuwa]|uniref:Uncharacterized protein n=1 Tax=Cucumis melo var. makuwa TaxID=1194695 RepID=A0A5A7SSD4_CUCMM|nr:hypothetical protein E6C27_scaffold43059G00410 [Cucumis melo var. makuwa]
MASRTKDVAAGASIILEELAMEVGLHNGILNVVHGTNGCAGFGFLEKKIINEGGSTIGVINWAITKFSRSHLSWFQTSGIGIL